MCRFARELHLPNQQLTICYFVKTIVIGSLGLVKL